MSPELAERRIILCIAKQQIELRLSKAQQNVNKRSKELLQMNVISTTKHQRDNAKLKLIEEYKKRDIWEERLKIINKMIEELRTRG